MDNTEQLEALTRENAALREANEVLQADIKTAAEFGVKISEMLGENALMKLPQITLKLATNPSGFTAEMGIDKILPLIEKYKHLITA